MKIDPALLATQHLAIVGLGLMGGSLALAARPAVARITAVDRDATTRQTALDRGIVDSATDDLADGLADADFVILATPVRTIQELLTVIPSVRPDGCFLLDLGSTKAAINGTMAALPPQFAGIGGHPMCGRENSGLTAATASLFQDQPFILCRHGRTTPEVEQLALSLIDCIGARPLFLEADNHDRLVAAVSHFPYLLSAVLARQAADMDDQVWSVAGSGFRDTSRLAGSDVTMMLDILLTNRTAVLAELEHSHEAVTELMNLLRQEDERGLYDWLTAARQAYQIYQQRKA